MTTPPEDWTAPLRELVMTVAQAEALSRLLREHAERGEDTARLDWMQENCAEVKRPDADTLYVRYLVCIRRNRDGDCTMSEWSDEHYGDIRGAIKKAVAARSPLSAPQGTNP